MPSGTAVSRHALWHCTAGGYLSCLAKHRANIHVPYNPSAGLCSIIWVQAHPAAGTTPIGQPLTEEAAAKAHLQRSQNLLTDSCLQAAAQPQAPHTVCCGPLTQV